MSDESESLVRIFRDLVPEDRRSVLAFAQFLKARVESGLLAGLSMPEAETMEVARVLPEPKAIDRPEDERVIAAIRRLSDTYYMFGKNDMMGDTSTMLTQHVLEGREASEVIDELEAMFLAQYEKMQREYQDSGG